MMATLTHCGHEGLITLMT